MRLYRVFKKYLLFKIPYEILICPFVSTRSLQDSLHFNITSLLKGDKMHHYTYLSALLALPSVQALVRNDGIVCFSSYQLA